MLFLFAFLKVSICLLLLVTNSCGRSLYIWKLVPLRQEPKVRISSQSLKRRNLARIGRAPPSSLFFPKPWTRWISTVLTLWYPSCFSRKNLSTSPVFSDSFGCIDGSLILLNLIFSRLELASRYKSFVFRSSKVWLGFLSLSASSAIFPSRPLIFLSKAYLVSSCFFSIIACFAFKLSMSSNVFSGRFPQSFELRRSFF